MKDRYHDLFHTKDNNYKHAVPEDSYSRELDSRVQESELPYGYTSDGPPADSGDHNMRRHETKKQRR